MITEIDFDIVVPTTGRASLAGLLEALAAGTRRVPGRVLLVDDRPGVEGLLLPLGPPPGLVGALAVVRGAGAGPAAARNRGWRASRAEWVAFLDDDVVPGEDWAAALARDLARLPDDVAGSQGRIQVPLPAGRRPTDWERNVRGLEDARWATADMAYRRAALAAVGGFDERFPRAYREDADLGLRLTRDGWRIANGRRVVEHPVRPARATASLRLQAGNRDDALMSALHGGRWRERAGAAPGRRRRHLAIAASASATLALAAARRPRPAAFAAAAWLGGTAELAWARIAPGPRTPREVALMTATSVAMPPVATGHWLVGLARRRRLVRDAARAPDAVLLDRDGTLVVDVPYNGDPEQVRPMPGARAALDRLRAAGIPLAVISNQSGVGRGILTDKEVRAVNRRVEQLLGPLGPWLVCPHAPKDACDCRKPAPGLVTRAALLLGVEPERCAVVGDIGSDLDAARAAGARGVLVPTPATRRDEVLSAAEIARDLPSAVELLIGAGS